MHFLRNFCHQSSEIICTVELLQVFILSYYKCKNTNRNKFDVFNGLNSMHILYFMVFYVFREEIFKSFINIKQFKMKLHNYKMKSNLVGLYNHKKKTTYFNISMCLNDHFII